MVGIQRPFRGVFGRLVDLSFVQHVSLVFFEVSKPSSIQSDRDKTSSKSSQSSVQRPSCVSTPFPSGINVDIFVSLEASNYPSWLSRQHSLPKVILCVSFFLVLKIFLTYLKASKSLTIQCGGRNKWATRLKLKHQISLGAS